MLSSHESRKLPGAPESITAEHGFTMVEMVVAMAVALVVFTGTLAILTSSLHAQVSVQNRSTQLQEAQAATQSMVRELREATSVTVNSSTSITLNEPASSGSQTVTYSCSSGKCTRAVTGGSTQLITSDVTNTDIFTGTPSASPTYVSVKLVLSSSGHTAWTITDGASLRNITLGS